MNGQPLVPLSKLQTYASGLDHPEGICLAPNGDIYAGGEAGQIYRISSDREVHEIANTGGSILGLAADAESNIYAIDIAHKVVWRVSPDGSRREEFIRGLPDRSLHVPNWGAFDADGNYYLTDSGDWGECNGFIWIIRPGGRPDVWTEEPVDFPNGCAVSADGSRLYVVESIPGAIIEIPINDNGSAGPRRLVHELGLPVPDGIAVTDDGSLVVSCYRPDTIYVWHPDDDLRILAEDPRGTVLAAPTNVAFTGPNFSTIVVSNLGRWHLTSFDTDLCGVPLFYPSSDTLGLPATVGEAA
jgi:gluconolactonase